MRVAVKFVCLFTYGHFVAGQKIYLSLNDSAVEGNTFQLFCSVSGSGSLIGLLVFQKQSSPNFTACAVNNCVQFTTPNDYPCGCVSGQTRQLYMNITSVRREDGNGGWTCQYTDLKRNTVNLDVHYPPVITSVPSSITLTENSSPNIDCSSNITPGNPSSTSYRWTGPGGYNKIGAVLDRTVNRTQGGQYTCTVTNTAGLSDTATVNINVQYGPTITSVPNITNVTENTSPSIDCSSNITPGNPSSTSYRWTGPGGYSTTGAVLDRTVIRTQGGQYTCTATNTAGLSDITAVNINVQYAPVITSVPSSKDVTENTSPNIDCSSNITRGNPSSARYRWTGPGGYSKTGAVLDRTVNRTQGGQYTCTATNAAGLSDTATVNINVQYGPGTSVTITPSSPHTVVKGSGSLTIACRADCRPACGLTLRKGGSNLGQGQVILAKVNRSDTGYHVCEAENGIGSASRTFTLVVQYLDIPSITVSPVQVMENDSVQIVCSVASNPTVQMTIRNMDNNTNLVDQEVTNSRQYVIQRAQCLHNGTYQCVADNRGIPSTQTASAYLNVLCSPRQDTRNNQTLTVAREFNETATLVADVIANPLPNFTWWRYTDGQLQPILNSTIYSVHSTDLQSVLEISVSHSRDYGMYAAQIENTVDTALLVFELTTKSPPFTPTYFDILVVGTTSVMLKWISNFNGGTTQTFFIEFRSDDSVWKNILDSGIADPGRDRVVTVNITVLQPNTKYIFTVFSENMYGKSEAVTTSITTNVASQPTSPDGPESNVAGAVAGGVVAGILVIIIIVVIVILYKRGTFGTKASGQQQRRNNEQNIPNVAFTPDPRNLYSDLDDSSSERQTYNELRPYQNMQVMAEDGNTGLYEGMQEKDPQTYEKIQIPTYENTKVRNKEPLYQNTRKN